MWSVVATRAKLKSNPPDRLFMHSHLHSQGARVRFSSQSAVYLVAMGEPREDGANYCDITSQPSCLEIDLFEGNTKALQATLHTTTSEGNGVGSCNKWGCAANEGKVPSQSYGSSSSYTINSQLPFEVSATFRETSWTPGPNETLETARGIMYDVTLYQDGLERQHHLFDGFSVHGSHSAHGRPAQIPKGDQARVRGMPNFSKALALRPWHIIVRE